MASSTAPILEIGVVVLLALAFWPWFLAIMLLAGVVVCGPIALIAWVETRRDRRW